MGLALAVLPVLAVQAGNAAAATRAATPRVVMVMLPSLDWPEFHAGLREGRLANLGRLAGGGAVGLMNTVTGGRPVMDDAYVTIGAGTRVVGGPAAGLAGERGEQFGGVPTEEMYAARMGRKAPPAGVLYLGLPGMIKANEGEGRSVVPGALGEELNRAGVRVAVVGNADAPPDIPARGSVAVAMDGAGAVDEGLIGRGALVRDGWFPGGWRTDYESVFAFFSSLGGDVGLVVIETGDLWRLDLVEPLTDRLALAAASRRALERADRLVGMVTRKLDPDRDLLLVVSPFPSEPSRREGAWLTPVIAWGRGIPQGLLTSATTRQPGLITNIDLVPTVLSHFGRQSPWFFAGRRLYGISVDPGNAIDHTQALYLRTLENHRRRPALVKGYIFLEIGVILVSLLALVSRARAAAHLWPFLVAGMAVPLALLALAGLPLRSQGWAYAVAVLLVAAISGIAFAVRRRGDMAPFGLIAAVTALAVLADALTGGRLMVNSPLGHSLIGGARFYGIGNEFMGVVIGASLIGGTAALDLFASRGRRGTLLVILFWLVPLAVLASPRVGANFGGAAAAGVAFLYSGLRLLLPGLRARHGILMIIAVAALLAITVLIDVSQEASYQSHIGRAFANLGTGGVGHLEEILLRKLSMNLRLIRWTNWSLLFLISLAAYVWLCFYPPAAMRRLLAPYPRLRVGFSGVAAGALTALVLNDSGIVAAATAMIFASAPLICLALKDLSSPPT